MGKRRKAKHFIEKCKFYAAAHLSTEGIAADYLPMRPAVRAFNQTIKPTAQRRILDDHLISDLRALYKSLCLALAVQPTGIPLNEAPVWQRALGMVAGAVMNFVLGFVVLVFLIAAQNEPITSKTIYAIQDGALCGQTGLQAGDKVLAVNGRRCFVANDILYELVRTRSYSADFTVLRDGQKVQLPGVQFDTWQDEQGETHMSIGFSVYGLEKTPGNVLREAGNSVLYYGRIVFTSLVDLVRGRESINNLSGPVGIVSAIGQAASYGWQDLLELLALITVNLGILNLLPFPALDGGKVVFLIIEGVTGHAVPEKLQSMLTLATFGLLFGLMIFATYNDILRLITGTV